MLLKTTSLFFSQQLVLLLKNSVYYILAFKKVTLMADIKILLYFIGAFIFFYFNVHLKKKPRSNLVKIFL